MKPMKLIMVTEDNNNKFINITLNTSGGYTAEWGRIGSKSNFTDYPESKFDSYVNSKLKKGYIDITDKVKEITSGSKWNIKDSLVLQLVEELMAAAKQKIEESYTIGVGSVNQKQIDEAQDLLDTLNQIRKDFDSHNKEDINAALKRLYTVLPRKMKNTRHHFLQEMNAQVYTELIQSEQNLLDTLSGQVVASNIATDSSAMTLDQFGIQIEKASQTDRDRISQETDFKLGNNQKVFKVVNSTTEKNFNPKNLKTKLLYHGSKNNNYWSILTKGLLVKPKGVPTTGNMFGWGIYTADKADKSIGYTSVSNRWSSRNSSDKGYLCLFEVAIGKTWNICGNSSYSSWMSSIDANKLSKENKDSVFAQAGKDLRNNEYIVYESSQITVRYIIELK